MEMNDLRIVYMGTPEFAVAPLKTLLNSGCKIVAVVTAPDRPAGRGKKIRQTAVKEFAIEKGLPVLQPENLKDPKFNSQLKQLLPDIQVVVAFRMLPEVVWRIPKMGTFNLHASLLPDYRGAAPINHAIIQGETVTGVTTFLIDEQIDTGRILLQEKTAIGIRETAGELHDRLMEMGAGLVRKTVEQLANGSVESTSQEELFNSGDKINSAPKIHREDCRINWSGKGGEIANLIRGLSPYPAAFTTLEREGEKSILCKIFLASFEAGQHNQLPGMINSDGKRELKVAVSSGYIRILSVQQEGKKRMDTGDFLKGINLTTIQSRFS